MRSFWGLVFAIFVSFAFAQEQHGVVFPLTETATTYNAADNYYDTSDEGSVRFSYTPSKTGYCSVYSSEHNSYFYRYLYSYGTDATFSQIELSDSDYYTAYFSFFCSAGETYYFVVDVYNDYEYSDEFDMKVTLQDVSIVTIQGKTEPDTVVKGKSFDISATVPANKRFMGWKIESGTGTFDNKNFKSTEFTPTSDKVTLSYGIEDAAVYEITKTASSYTPAEHYYSNPYSDVRLYFVAPSDGGYIINVKKTALSSYYVYRYSSGDFSSNDKYSIASSEWADTLLLSKGDSVFYKLDNYNTADSLDAFKVSYKGIDVYTVTVDVESSDCSFTLTCETTADCDDSKMPAKVTRGKPVRIEGSSVAGSRPNGWKVVSGSRRFGESTSYSLVDTIYEDTKIKLLCSEAQMRDVSEKKQSFTPADDFYEKGPQSGIYFRFEAPTTDLYVLHADPDGLYGTYTYYGTNEPFSSTYEKQYSYVRSSTKNFIKADNVGDVYYLKVTPYSDDYYNNSVSVFVDKASVVYVDGDVLDTFTVGDLVSLSATIPEGQHFSGWKIDSGTGSFSDKKDPYATFIPTSTVVKLSSKFKTLPIYELTDKDKGFTYEDNSSMTNYYKYYGIRASYTANVSGRYFLTYRTARKATAYRFYDSTFSSYSASANCNPSGSMLNCRMSLQLDEDSTAYFLFYPTADASNDSVYAKVLKTVKVSVDTVGDGDVYIGGYGNLVDSTSYVSGDSVRLQANAFSTSRFKYWQKVSGSCKISDSTNAVTSVYVNGDCRLKAVFGMGSVYAITTIPTEYTTAQHYYSGNVGGPVRFKFVAPATGTYAFAFTRLQSSSFYVYRYGSSAFGSYNDYKSGYQSLVDSMKLDKGDSVFYTFQNSSSYDNEIPFWVSYSNSKVSITLDGGKNGTVIPENGYPVAWKDVAYPINAVGKSGYRFYRWKVITGNGTIADDRAKQTMVSAKDTITVKASFKEGEVYEITGVRDTFNFRDHYFCDSTNSQIRFTWTPSDTNTYLLTFTHIDTLYGTFINYGKDSTYTTPVRTVTVIGDSSVLVQGIPGITQYWTFEDARTTEYPNKSFQVEIRKPYVMYVESNQGRAIPSGFVYLEPGKDTVVTVSAYGGYVFDSWKLVDGKAKIDAPSSQKTKVIPQSEYCHIKANYVLDFTVEPSIEITGIDLSNHPGICTEVSVVDDNTGRPIYGLDSTNFVLFQDQKSLPVQVTSIQDFGGVSVALVVDESGSMGSQDIADVKTAVRAFIDAMGPSDRTTLIGFETSARIIQPMTSDKNALYAAANQIHSGGGTAITNGAYAALEELANEAGSTTIIIFSDGSGQGSYSTQAIVEKAFWQNTVIHSVGIGSGATREPLKGMAEGTGGTFAVAPSATELSNIYASIQSSVQAKYVLCYQSPDTVLNGDTHEVVVKTNFVNKNDVDTAYWSEDNLPPQIKLTKDTWKKVGVSQKLSQKNGDSLEISVYVTSRVPVVSTRIYIQRANTSRQSYVSYEMEQVNDSLWRFVVPSGMAVPPGIDFYVMATDSLSLIGKAPLLPNPAKEPYTIPIKNDVPEVVFSDVECVDTTGGYGYMAFTISDVDGIYKSSIHYKDSLAVLFREVAMTRDAGDIWFAKIPADAFSAGTLEYYVRAMDGEGVSVRYEKKSNFKISACLSEYSVPDVEDELKIVAMDEEEGIKRETPYIGLTLTTQDFSFRVDSAKVKLSCLISGDIENNIILVEEKGGFFKKDSIPKDELSAKRDNGVISCAPIDTLVAEYVDPYYSTTVYDTVVIHDTIAVGYRFLEKKKDNVLDSVETTKSVPFRVRVTAESKSLTKVDTLKVLLFTDTGDSLWVKAIETGKYTSMFEYTGEFFFVEEKSMLKDSRLDVVFNLDTIYNRVKIQAHIAGDSSELGERDSLIVFSNYVPADVAEIYDADLDGQADSIRIHFMRKLESMVSSIDTIYWNAVGEDWRKVSKKYLNMSDDEEWVEAKLKDAFDYGLTAPDTGEAPYVRVTKTSDDFSQKVKLVDRVGAVPAKAVKHPGTLSMTEYMDPDAVTPPDTIVVTLSEPIRKLKRAKKDEWKKLFYHSASCDDSKEYPMNLAKEPTVDSTGMVWTLILDDYNMIVGNCIRTNPDVSYEDLSKNSMGHGGIEIEGNDGDRYLYEVTPYPSVSGVGKGAKWIPPKGDSWVKIPDTLSTVKIASIAPYKAHITIFDGYSNVVASFKQTFGYDGEMKQKIRGNDENRAKIGYIYWNQRSDEGRKVGTGVYIWHIDFKFKDGHKEFRLLKTGIKRKK